MTNKKLTKAQAEGLKADILGLLKNHDYNAEKIIRHEIPKLIDTNTEQSAVCPGCNNEGGKI